MAPGPRQGSRDGAGDLRLARLEAAGLKTITRLLRTVIRGRPLSRTELMKKSGLNIAIHRSLAVKHEFQHRHPCPSTGRTSGKYPGYIEDDVVPLARGGPDAASNLQWQTTAEAKAKDVDGRTGLELAGPFGYSGWGHPILGSER